MALHTKDLGRLVGDLRVRLEPAFTPETAVPGSKLTTPSSGQCAAVALIVHALLGGKLVSTRVAGTSHWFNRLVTSEGEFDVDLTGDQFGRPAVQLATAGALYDATIRSLDEVKDETLRRAASLATAAHLIDAASVLARR